MVKLILFIGFAVLSTVSGAFPFRIEGRLLQQEGQIVLVSGQDTLAKAYAKGGKFLLRGEVDHPQVAYLLIDGRQYTAPLFLEKGNYEVRQVDAKKLQIDGGGELQRQESEYLEALRENTREIQENEQKLKQARQDQKLFEVMHYRAERLELDSVRNEIENRFLARYPESLVSLYHFYKGLRKLSPGQLDAKYRLLGEAAKQTEWGQTITRAWQNWNKLAPGSIAPDFTLNTPQGEAVTLYQVKARVKLLDFWASWCGPCRAENPELVQLYRKYKDKGFEIISVSLDHKLLAWEKAIRADGLTWVHVSSLKGWECPVASLYHINSVPACFLLDAGNRIVAVKVWGEELEKQLTELLEQ